MRNRGSQFELIEFDSLAGEERLLMRVSSVEIADAEVDRLSASRPAGRPVYYMWRAEPPQGGPGGRRIRI